MWDMQGRDFIMEVGNRVPSSRTFLPEVQRQFQRFPAIPKDDWAPFPKGSFPAEIIMA